MTPWIPVTTNLMEFYKPLDYFKWGKSMDFVSWDNYPDNGTPAAVVALGGYPGPIWDVLGIWVEEWDALPSGQANGFVWNGKHYPASLLCDIMHMEQAREMAVYESDFYQGTPVIACNDFGEGTAWYVGTRSNEEFYRDFVAMAAETAGVRSLWAPVKDVEIAERRKGDRRYLFFLNHSEEERELTMEAEVLSLLEDCVYKKGERVRLGGKGVLICQATDPI